MKKLNTLNLLLVIVCCLPFSLSLLAQTDAHYWTSQFGAKGLLLNGAVIASTEDETAIFYNPGAMTSDDDFNFSLSFLTPTYSILTTENFLSNNTTVKDRNFGFAPGLGSFGFNPWGSEKVRMAITSFTRFKSSIRFRGRIVNEVSGSPDQLFIGNLEFQRSLSERWIGCGASYKINDYFSIGLSQFMTFHSESNDVDLRKELVDRNNPTLITLGWRNQLKYNYSTKGGLITKLGSLAKFGDVKIGLTITSPTYAYSYSSASYEFNDLKIYGQDSTILVSNLNGAKLQNYKTPLSIGFGLAFPIRKTKVSFSIEYFKAISTYTVIQDTDDPFDGLAPGGEENSVLVETGNQRVVNFAIGCETQLSEKLSLIWGFRTDFNQRRLSNDIESLQFLSTTPDVFHVSIGNTFEIWNSNFSYGLDYGFGSRTDDTQLINFSKTSSENFFNLTGDGSVISKFQSINFILAYDFSFRKKRKREKKK